MQKLIKNLRKKWPTYLFEILVLVIGIYGAFALDNWNEKRKDQEAEMGYYCKLLADFELDKLNINKRYNEADNKIEISKKLLIDLHERSRDKEYLINTHIQALRTNAFVPSKTAMTDLTSSGNLNLLKNDEIKSQLIRYYAELDHLLIQLEINRNYSLQRGFGYSDDIKYGYQQADYLKKSLGGEILKILPMDNWHLNADDPYYRQYQNDLINFVGMGEREKQHFKAILKAMEPIYSLLENHCIQK